jgi:hypothetical protein
MRRFWRLLLPILGVLLFSLVSWQSLRVNREIHQHLPNKYFLWSAIRLDTDPANRRNWDMRTCKNGDENCVSWDLKNMWVDPGLLDGFLLLTAFPAFVLCRLIVGFLGKMGINEFTSFMLLMPVLLLIWFYFVGRVLDGWIQRKSKRSGSSAWSTTKRSI